VTPLRREFSLFALGGLIGFVIDGGIAQALVRLAEWNVYGARVVSFLAAATFTWWWSRHQTFAHRESGRDGRSEWLHWIGLMMVGAAFNNGAYVLVLHLFPALRAWPAVAVAAGSVSGAAANFLLARTVLFNTVKTEV
jgi:putative flippase GtrA